MDAPPLLATTSIPASSQSSSSSSSSSSESSSSKLPPPPEFRATARISSFLSSARTSWSKAWVWKLMYPQFPQRPSPPSAAISTPNLREDGRCWATRCPLRGDDGALPLELPLAPRPVVVAADGASTLGMPSSSLPHTRAVKENPTNMGQDIHSRSRSSEGALLLAPERNSLEDFDAADRGLDPFRKAVGSTQVRKGTAIPVRLDDSKSLMASLTVSLVASPLPLPLPLPRTAMCPSRIPRLTSTMTRPPLRRGRTALEDHPPPFRMGKKESEWYSKKWFLVATLA
mmetsp:Transcript_4211/g.12072  ORF Transcript_4211/g.12072 Transcript_4211/m.12072 type:complete len:286 (+) Transcript_4211:1350-2207(+)